MKNRKLFIKAYGCQTNVEDSKVVVAILQGKLLKGDMVNNYERLHSIYVN
ncbi:MAG: hypothetical protein ACK5M7_14500 [Draconibacterium sp.]